MNFCRRCGKPLAHVENRQFTCPNGHTLFSGPAPCVGIFFLTADNRNVLLSVRGIEPRKGMLDSFGGFVDNEESFEAAAVRELQEELALQPDEYEPLKYLVSAYGTYPYEGEPLPVLCILFWSRLTTDRKLMPYDDVGGIKEIPLHSVDPSELHDEDIRTGIAKLRELFPITQKQEVS